MKERLERLLMESLRKDPSRKVLWWNDEWWNAGDLVALVADTRKVLERGGFKEGYRLAVLLPNSPMVLALSMAVWSLGGTISTLNAKAGFTSLSGTLKLIDPFSVVISSEIQELGKQLMDTGFPVTQVETEKAPSSFTGKDCSLDDPELAIIFATSGTTGLPKAVPLTHTNLLDNAMRVFDHVEELKEGDVMINVLPNFHSFGYTVSGILPLLNGMSQTILPSFMPPSSTLRAINVSGVNDLVMVPAMLSFLIGTVKNSGSGITSSLKVVITGGDKLNVQIDRKVEDLFGVGVLEGYGLTECSPVVSVNPSYSLKKLGTVGTFLEGYDWQLRSNEGLILDKGKEGILWVRGPSVGGSYFRAPETSSERFIDGWFNTGDVVKVDGEGYLTILDRATDIIIVGGFNVYPQEVESILNRHPEISAAIAVGIPHPVNGELVKVFVMREAGSSLSERDVIDYCKKELAHFKVPRKVEFLDSFPLSPTGKILRRKLRELA